MTLFGKTRSARIWGASDRMICVKGIDAETDEFNVTSHPKLHDGAYVATLKIDAGVEGSPHVHAFYDGCWSFAVSPGEDGVESLPAWPIQRFWGSVNNHSETLEIEVPKKASIGAIDRFEDV